MTFGDDFDAGVITGSILGVAVSGLILIFILKVLM